MSAQQKGFFGGSIITGFFIVIFTAVISWGSTNIQKNNEARVMMPVVMDKLDAMGTNQTLQHKAVLTKLDDNDNKMDVMYVFMYENRNATDRLSIRATHCEDDIKDCKGRHNVQINP